MGKKEESVEETIRGLLKPPGLQYLREISKILDQDPDYLQFHSASISVKVNELLSRSTAGDARVSERDVAKIVREAVIRLRSVEK